MQPAPHIHARETVPRLMTWVIVSLLPAIAVHCWIFGWGLAIHLLIAIFTALLTEAGILYLRNKSISNTLMDGSAILTASLLAFCIPSIAPWWITVIGVAFAISVAKHLYGGLGFNPFNPAMVGYVLLLVSFPVDMTNWVMPFAFSQYGIGLGATLDLIFNATLPAHISIDAITMATPLDSIKMEIDRGQNIDVLLNDTSLFGLFGGRGWEWINICLLAGGLWLIYKKVIAWHIPIAVIAAICSFSLLFHVYDSSLYVSPVFHFFNGATLMGAFFIATDPVTASTTTKGRLIYGFGIGALTFIIRTWGGYPDGVAFAVLIMNMAAPTIDNFTQPKVFGHKHN